MAQYVAEQMAWDLNEFEVVRVTMDYAPLGSTIMLRFPLAGRGLTSAPPIRSGR